MREAFGKSSCTQDGIFQCNYCRNIFMVFQFFKAGNFYKGMRFEDNHVLKMRTQISVHDFLIQLEGILVVKERGQTLFISFTLFRRYLGRYVLMSGK